MDISTWGTNPAIRKKENLYLTSQFHVPIYDFFEYRISEGSQEYLNLMQNELKEVVAIDAEAIQRNLSTCCYNCHGLSLASRRGWLNDVEIVIKNDSYKLLENNEALLPGDIVAYLDIDKGEYSITHTGIISYVSDNGNVEQVISGNKKCIIVSKWGMWGEYIHNLLKCPYTKNTTTYKISFYRFTRTCY